MPRLATAYGGRLAIDRPSSAMVPLPGEQKPESTLRREVFPAPFGPITAWMRCGFTVRVTPANAATPPNPRFPSLATRSGSGPSPCPLPRGERENLREAALDRGALETAPTTPCGSQ